LLKTNSFGEYKQYHENRRLSCAYTYIDNKKNGEAKEYDENGELIEHSIWNNGVKVVDIMI
jgi:antitoxin component YwqK of YwqJK toxin-antitoxin module